MIPTASTNIGMFLKCNESHYLATREGGNGIDSVFQNEHLIFGTAMHDPIEALMLGEKDIKKLVDKLKSDLKILVEASLDGTPRSTEYYWLGTGLLLAFAEFKLPKMLRIYDVKAVEKELTIDLGGGITWCTRPDVILERRKDHRQFNNNVKTSSYTRDIGIIFEFSVQMLMEALAVSRELGIDTGGTVITSLNKGRKGYATASDKARGFTEGTRIDSPFTYVWYDEGGKALLPKWKSRAVKVGAWELCETPFEWYEWFKKTFGPEALEQEVDFTEPLIHNTRMDVDSVVRDIIQIETSGSRIKNYDACNNYGGYGKPCKYKQWCWGTAQERASLYVPRNPNHPLEELPLDDF